MVRWLGLGWLGFGLGLGLGLARLPQVSHAVVGCGDLVRVGLGVGFGLGSYLPYISPNSPQHLAYISPASRLDREEHANLYLAYISPISRLYLA